MRISMFAGALIVIALGAWAITTTPQVVRPMSDATEIALSL